MDANAGDAEIERLLAHSDWLSALARRLVRDPAAADDLVQDTWHAALRSPPGLVHSERGWLSALIANLARARRRGEGARQARERSCPAAEPVERPDRLVERAESQRNLLSLVLALDEPYRSTLLARYVEGRSAVEIARRTGVKESTVRTRIARALDRLRARLASEHGSDPRLGLALLLPASEGGPDPGTAAAVTVKTATFAMGVWVMGTTAKLAVAAAAVLVAWLAWRQFAPVSRPLELELAGTTASDPTRAVLPRGTEAVSGGREALEKVAATKPALDPRILPAAATRPLPAQDATLDIVFTCDGAPVRGVSGWLLPEIVPGRRVAEGTGGKVGDVLDVHFAWPGTSPRAKSDARGIAAFRELPQALYIVGFDLSSSATKPMRFAGGIRMGGLHTGYQVEIRLGRSAVHGRVFDELGRPRPGVGVLVKARHPQQPSHLNLAAHGVTDARGEYRFAELLAASYEVVMEPDGRFDERGESRRRVIELAVEEDLELDFGSAIPGPRWSGRLLNAFDEPFPGAPRLVLEQDQGATRIHAPVDPKGKFQLTLTPGRWRVRAFAPGSSPAGFDLGEVDLPTGELVRDLVVPGTRVHGRVLPLDAAVIPPADLGVDVRPKGNDFDIRTVEVSADGSYWIDGLGPGVWVAGLFPGRIAEPVELVIVEGTRSIERDLRWTVD